MNTSFGLQGCTGGIAEQLFACEQDMQAALAGMLWAVGDKAGAQRCCDLVGGAEILNQFLYSQQAC